MLDAHNVCNHRPVDPLEIEDASLRFEFSSDVWPDRIANHDSARAGRGDEADATSVPAP